MEGNILDMNREAERAYGWSQEELLNHPVKMLVPTELHFHADDLLTRCRLGETVRNEESVRRDKLGQTHWVLLTLSLLTDQTDEPFGIVSIAKDITDLKQTAGKLRRGTSREEPCCGIGKEQRKAQGVRSNLFARLTCSTAWYHRNERSPSQRLPRKAH